MRKSLAQSVDELVKYNFKKNIILEASDKTTIEAIKTYDCRIIFHSKGYGDALKELKQLRQNFFVFLMQMDHLIKKNWM